MVKVISDREVRRLSNFVYKTFWVYGGANEDTTVFEPVCYIPKESSEFLLGLEHVVDCKLRTHHVKYDFLLQGLKSLFLNQNISEVVFVIPAVCYNENSWERLLPMIMIINYCIYVPGSCLFDWNRGEVYSNVMGWLCLFPLSWDVSTLSATKVEHREALSLECDLTN